MANRADASASVSSAIETCSSENIQVDTEDGMVVLSLAQKDDIENHKASLVNVEGVYYLEYRGKIKNPPNTEDNSGKKDLITGNFNQHGSLSAK